MRPQMHFLVALVGAAYLLLIQVKNMLNNYKIKSSYLIFMSAIYSRLMVLNCGN